MTFEAIEASGVVVFLQQIRDELVTCPFRHMRNWRQAIPKDGGQKVGVLSIPAIRDRVVQGALKLILEPIFEADFPPGSYDYRPKRSAHDAVKRVAEAIAKHTTRVLDVDLRAFFDNGQPHMVLEKVARRVDDADVKQVLTLSRKASGQKGVPQGGVISPFRSNLYLNEVDRMLERAKEVTRHGKYTYLEYARGADDLVILVDASPPPDWRLKAVDKRSRKEFAKLHVEINEEKSRVVDLATGESCGFLGFDFRRVRSLNGAWRPNYTPKLTTRTALLRKLKDIFRRFQSQPVDRVVDLINLILRGWVHYFAVDHSSQCFSSVRDWVEQRVRRQLMRARKLRGFEWRGGGRDGSMTGWAWVTGTASVDSCSSRTRSQPARSHNPWCKANRKAECGKSARSVCRGGGWKRGHGRIVNPTGN